MAGGRRLRGGQILEEAVKRTGSIENRAGIRDIMFSLERDTVFAHTRSAAGLARRRPADRRDPHRHAVPGRERRNRQQGDLSGENRVRRKFQQPFRVGKHMNGSTPGRAGLAAVAGKPESRARPRSAFRAIELATYALTSNWSRSDMILGTVYALVAIGLSLIFGVSGIVNLSHGEFVMLGAFIDVRRLEFLGLNPIVALPVSMAGAVRGRRRDASLRDRGRPGQGD